MICSMRGNPRVDEMRPKLEEPNVMFGPLNCVLLNTLMISARTIRAPPPIGSVFWNAMSVWVLNGVRMRVSVRGALPKVNGAAVVQAAGLNQLLRQLQDGS